MSEVQVGDLVIAPVLIQAERVMTLGIYKGGERRLMVENLIPQPDSDLPGRPEVAVIGADKGFGTIQEQKSCIRKATVTDVLLLNTLNSLGLLGAPGGPVYVDYVNYNELIDRSMQGQGVAGDPLTLHPGATAGRRRGGAPREPARLPRAGEASVPKPPPELSPEPDTARQRSVLAASVPKTPPELSPEPDTARQRSVLAASVPKPPPELSPEPDTARQRSVLAATMQAADAEPRRPTDEDAAVAAVAGEPNRPPRRRQRPPKTEGAKGPQGGGKPNRKKSKRKKKKSNRR